MSVARPPSFDESDTDDECSTTRRRRRASPAPPWPLGYFNSRKAAESAQRLAECVEECCGLSRETFTSPTTRSPPSTSGDVVMAPVPEAVLHAPFCFVDRPQKTATRTSSTLMPPGKDDYCLLTRPTRTLCSIPCDGKTGQPTRARFRSIDHKGRTHQCSTPKKKCCYCYCSQPPQAPRTPQPPSSEVRRPLPLRVSKTGRRARDGQASEASAATASARKSVSTKRVRQALRGRGTAEPWPTVTRSVRCIGPAR